MTPVVSRITRVTLRAGTRYFTVVDERLAAPLTLDRDVEVLVGDLGQRPGEFNTYEADDGTTILIRLEDELRG